MEGRLWIIVLTLLPAPNSGRSRFFYDRRTILMVLLWAVLHDRPQSWACDPANWPDALRPPALPDPSTLSRRKRRDDVHEELVQAQDAIRGRLGEATRDAAIDSRPVVVGGGSKDRMARAGRAVGGFARGYRAHMLVDAAGIVRGLAVRPMSVNERIVARPLLAHAPRPIQRVVADANYDSVALHRIAAQRGVRFYTGIRLGRVGRRQNPRRVRLQQLSRTEVGKKAFAKRDAIERVFGRMSNIACGLKALPAWVRGFDRAAFWIEAKVLIYHAYLLDIRNRQLKVAA